MITAQIANLEAALARLGKNVPSAPQLEILIARLIVFLGRDLSAVGDRVLRPHGLTETDFRVLMAIFSHEADGASPTDLCAKVAQSAANITRISDLLVERGFINRTLSDRDRRRWVLRLTPRGSQFVRELLPDMFEPMRRAFGDLRVTDRKRLSAMLKTVAASIDALQLREAEGG